MAGCELVRSAIVSVYGQKKGGLWVQPIGNARDKAMSGCVSCGVSDGMRTVRAKDAAGDKGTL